MGLTPLEGLVMGTRSGDFDPAILFYLSEKGHDVDSLNILCNKKSGLLGISGISNDMLVLQEEAGKGSARAALAIDIFCYRVKKSEGKIIYLPQTVCTHQSGGSVRPVMARMVWFSHLAFLRYLRKHHYSPLDQLWYLLAWPPTIIAAALRSVWWGLRNLRK